MITINDLIYNNNKNKDIRVFIKNEKMPELYQNQSVEYIFLVGLWLVYQPYTSDTTKEIKCFVTWYVAKDNFGTYIIPTQFTFRGLIYWHVNFIDVHDQPTTMTSQNETYYWCVGVE